MIFYFSGTGNSKFVADRLLGENEQLFSIAKLLQDSSTLGEENIEIDVAEDEAVGLVFPVYFYTLPSIVECFVSKLKLNRKSYVYAVITCGGGIGQAGNVLSKKLKKQGIRLAYVEEVLMPDNSM